jgi:hypothetical protein
VPERVETRLALVELPLLVQVARWERRESQAQQVPVELRMTARTATLTDRRKSQALRQWWQLCHVRLVSP